MADVPSPPGNQPPATPRWVKVFGVIVVVLVLLFVCGFNSSPTPVPRWWRCSWLRRCRCTSRVAWRRMGGVSSKRVGF